MSANHPWKAEWVEVHVVDDQCVVYDADTDRIHYLSPTAALVLEFCDGDHSPDEIAAFVQNAYRLPGSPIEEVRHCVKRFEQMEFIRGKV